MTHKRHGGCRHPSTNFPEILLMIAEPRPQPSSAPGLRLSMVIRSRATDGRSASSAPELRNGGEDVGKASIRGKLRSQSKTSHGPSPYSTDNAVAASSGTDGLQHHGETHATPHSTHYPRPPETSRPDTTRHLFY